MQHRPDRDGNALHRAVQISSAAGSRLPPPTRAPRRARVSAPPLVSPNVIPRSTLRIELDEPTFVDGPPRGMPPPLPVIARVPRAQPADRAAIVPPLKPPPMRAVPAEHTDAERTEVVIPLPPPIVRQACAVEGAARVEIERPEAALARLGIAPPVASPGGRIEPRAANPDSHRAARLFCAATGITAMLVIAIGFPMPSPGPGAPQPYAPPVVTVREPTIAPQPPPPRREPAETRPEADLAATPSPIALDAESSASSTEPLRGERDATRPARSHRATPAATGANHKPAARSPRGSRALSYDPDALFLKRP